MQTTETPTAKQPRPRSKLTEVGDAAARAAKRKLLLKTLRATGWSLAETRDALGMTASSNVIAAIDDLGLRAMYDAARAKSDPKS